MKWRIQALAESKDTAEVFLYDTIDNDSFWGITANAFVNEIKALGNVKNLTVRINSFGGDVFNAQAMYNFLRSHKAHVTVKVDGIAASAASIVAMAGDEIIMPENAMMMIHNPSTFVDGEAKGLLKSAEILSRVRDTLVAAYTDRTKLSSEKVIELMDAETWMTAQQAFDLGFCTQIGEALPVAACVKGLGSVPEEYREKLPGQFLSEVTAMAEVKTAPVTEPVEAKVETPIENAINVEAIRAEAVRDERARLKELDDLMAPGCEGIINKAKYETFADARDIALELLKASRNAQALSDRAADASAVDKVLTPQRTVEKSDEERENEIVNFMSEHLKKTRGN